ncbi:hypothetical protein V512_005620 [Mesotoga sp. Brook.08.105.5.1]|nr:hypothetical protein RM69_03400 [Mesotoga sp. SC_NapDC3]PVD16410.1 hypothetical protein V512_005620 [Mesotoga sp. Brook.08.105.5.1]
MSVLGSPFSDSIGRSVPARAPKFLVPELGALFLVRKSGKVRDEERERDRGESSRLLVSAANVSKDRSRLISIISVNVPLLFYG